MPDPTIPAVPPPEPPAGTPPDRAVRVAYCRRLIARGFWVVGESAGELAALWGLAESTIEHEATEAFKSLQDAQPDAVAMRNHCLGIAARASEEAAKSPHPHHRAKLLLEANKQVIELTGCAAPRKQQVQLTGGGDDWLTEEVKP